MFPVYPKSFISYRRLCYSREFRLPREVEEKRLGAKEFSFLAGPDSPFPFAHKPTAIKCILTEKPYPIKALFAFNNLILCSENSREALKAPKKLGFLVVADFFMTPTAELADIVLPVATWLEKDEVCHASYTNFIACRQKAIEPVGECWDDIKIVFELAKKMHLNRKYIPWKTVEQYNDYLLRGMGISFNDFKARRYIKEQMTYKKYENSGFNTPSGKVKLCSSILKIWV